MKLYLKQRVFAIGDKYKFTDSKGNLVYKGKKPALSITRMYLYDINGDEVCYIKRRLISLMPKYKVFKNRELKLFVRKKLRFGRPRFVVQDGNQNEYMIKGSWLAWDFTIYMGDQYIGSIHKKFMHLGDTYELDVADNYDPALFCAMTLIIDNSLHNNRNKRFGLND